MKHITATDIQDHVAQLCINANLSLPASLRCCLQEATAVERGAALGILQDLARNLEVAETERLPICQDTGMVVVFAELGQDVHVTGGGFEEAIQRGVAKGYREGYLRCSMVSDPLQRKNTGDNTPAVIHTRIVPGDQLRLCVSPKGFGSENMSRLRMLTPAAGIPEIKAFVLETVQRAGANACPPMVIGVGLGGNFEQVTLLAKTALCRSAGTHHPDPLYEQLEQELLEEVNALGIGPQGFGGNTTALWLAIETAPTHIAGLPLAVNIGCHVTRHAEIIL